MKNLNQLISGYTSQLQQGDIQLAYKGILEYIGKLRADIVKKYPSCDISSIYQGYMDMSYFSLSTKILKDKGLKIAVCCIIEIPKVADQKWRKLHLHFGESCKTL